MLDLDAIMHNLIVAKLGKGIVEEDNPYHWLARDIHQHHMAEAKTHCLFCGECVSNLAEGADGHALAHIKEFNLTAFL